jgi:hypothetical protein
MEKNSFSFSFFLFLFFVFCFYSMFFVFLFLFHDVFCFFVFLFFIFYFPYARDFGASVVPAAAVGNVLGEIEVKVVLGELVAGLSVPVAAALLNAVALEHLLPTGARPRRFVLAHAVGHGDMCGTMPVGGVHGMIRV